MSSDLSCRELDAESAECRGWQLRELRGLTRRLGSLRNHRRDTLHRVHACVDAHGPPGNKSLFLNAEWRDPIRTALSQDAWLVLDSLLSDLDHALKLTQRLETRILELTEVREDARRLKAIPGIGWILAATILAEVGDISRFRSARNFAAYTGLVTRVRASGGTAHYGHITRAGPSDLRWALGQAVVCALSA